MKYYKRVADIALEEVLSLRGAVLIEGIKWCGKTTSGKHKAQSIIDLSIKKEADRAEALVYEDSDKLFSTDKPILIDEWQKVPAVWDGIRNYVDKHQMPGAFILTGSTSQRYASDSLKMHSGVGRIGRMKMLTMSLYESDDSNGEISLSSLFDNPGKIYSDSPHSLLDIAFLAVRGGWPGALNIDKKLSSRQAGLYIDEFVESDIQSVDGHRRSAVKMRKILRSYARLSGSNAPNTAIEKDAGDISKNTLADYLKVLDELFITNETAAWKPNLRAGTAVQTSNTRYFTDPSITASVLGAGENDLLSDFETFGFVFETLVIRDLKAYALALGGDVYHYRDSDGLECDAVLHLRNGKYGLIEVKISPTREDEGASTLRRLKRKLENSGGKGPDFLLVITATGYAHKRDDGVYVVPVGCLRY